MELINIHGNWNCEQAGLVQVIPTTGTSKDWVWRVGLGCCIHQHSYEAKTWGWTMVDRKLAPMSAPGLGASLMGELNLPY